MTELTDLGRTPIPGPQPAGSDVREEPAFEQMEAEIGKMSSPVHSATMDWTKVTQLATELLLTKGKDVLVACYLTGGLLETRKLDGMADGLQVIEGMLQTYWDDMFPPLKRIRGRRNALQWLIDRLQQRSTEMDWSSLPPQPPELVTRLTASLQAIDAVLVEKDSEAPSMRALLTLVKALPVKEEASPAQTAGQTAVSSTAAGTSAAPAVAAAPTVLTSTDDADKALDDTCIRLGQMAEWLLSNDSSNPLAYRLNRLAAWTNLNTVPPADNGQTRLPAPISQVVDALAQLTLSQSDADLVQFAEAQLPAFPFWLDLNCLCAAALARMGPAFAAARQEVCGETARLLDRLPGLAQLSFASGMPFADGTTQAWLATLGSGAAAGGAAAPSGSDAVTTAIGNARAMAGKDDLVGAAQCLQDALAGDPSAPDQLRLKIRLCELLLAHRPGAALHAFARDLMQVIERHQLAVWDPALALEGLKVAYNVMSQRDEDAPHATALLEKIVALDASAAVKLVT